MTVMCRKFPYMRRLEKDFRREESEAVGNMVERSIVCYVMAAWKRVEESPYFECMVAEDFLPHFSCPRHLACDEVDLTYIFLFVL